MRKSKKTLQDIPISIKTIVKKPITIPSNIGILEAKNILTKYRIGRLIVLDADIPIGIITEKDIVKNISVFSGKPITKIKISEIMSKNLVTATSENTLKSCAKEMLKKKISSIIIKDKSGALEGIITKTDLISAFLIQSNALTKTSSMMTKKVISVSPDDSIYEVESVLLNNEISRLIVEEKGIPVGIITYRDFIPAKSFDLYSGFDPIERTEIFQISMINEFNAGNRQHMLTFRAKDIMTKNPIGIFADEPVYTAAILMIRNNISGLPVLRGKKTAGIITKTDIIKIIAEESKN